MREPEAPEASGWITYKRLLRWILPYRLLLGLAFVGMIIEAAAAGAFTSLMQPMIDETLVSQNDA
ncbi:MAG: hypothetical protein ACOVKB_02350, partial [Silanimonas sp.]